MTRQILLNVNFCDDISTYELEKNETKIDITTGYSFSEIRLVPQETEGICVIYSSGKLETISLLDLKSVRIVEGGGAFAIIQHDTGITADAIDEEMIRSIENVLEGHRCTGLEQKNAEKSNIPLISGAARDYTEILTEKLGMMLEPYFERWAVGNRTDARIKHLVNMINESYGGMSLPVLADAAGCTVRHVHRLFQEELGIGPKEFSRIVRVRCSVQRMLENPYGKITNYMEGMGYSDQAHFQREFKWYTGYTPGNFLKVLGDKQRIQQKK